MKKLTVLLATLFVFFSADAQQILSGIYSGSMYNDTTKMLTKYELALSEYRGKVFGYSYNTFIVNDTFYYGIRRVKGYKNDKGELLALNVKVGDRVLFGKYSGQTVKVNGDELLVMKEDDLFAVVEK